MMRYFCKLDKGFFMFQFHTENIFFNSLNDTADCDCSCLFASPDANGDYYDGAFLNCYYRDFIKRGVAI